MKQFMFSRITVAHVEFGQDRFIFMKQSERTLALRAASPDQFMDSCLTSALSPQDPDLEHIRGDINLECVHKGYILFPLLKRLHADLSLTFREGERSCSLLVKESETKIGTEAFKLVEVQLGFLFDVLYTKASIIYKRRGLVLRLVSVLSIVAALVAFHIVMDDTYSRVDVVITYFLFAGAVSLEIYAFVSLILSDWTMYWLTKGESRFVHFVYPCIARCRPILCREKRWSGYMGQHNLVRFCLREKGTIDTNWFSKICFEFNLLRKREWIKVEYAYGLESLISKALENKYTTYKESTFDVKILKRLLSHRGDNAVENFHDVIGWSFEGEFDHTILVWHVATDICYHSNSPNKTGVEFKVAKILSDYLFYILLMRPSMLPKCIDRITYVRETFNHVIKLLHRSNVLIRRSEEACELLIQLHREGTNLDVRRSGDHSNSVLIEACRLALELQDNLGDNFWEVICGVWIEMLTYAASHGEWGSHAQQLRNGGELLTHVGLLMADLGLSEHFGLRTDYPWDYSYVFTSP